MKRRMTSETIKRYIKRVNPQGYGVHIHSMWQAGENVSVRNLLGQKCFLGAIPSGS
jgi:hypothetical protein